ncbi:JAB domain-containing protein [Sorangium sp. So ce1000]|uniref:JAB domain-containing protein n=1 Tax=Sorangium sp. So ce1000 TaxID=3133325 RepID=UPI003F5E3E70
MADSTGDLRIFPYRARSSGSISGTRAWHNRPAGDPMPSPEDIELTTAIKRAADLMSIPLVDHIIIGGRGRGFRSMLDLCTPPPDPGRASSAPVPDEDVIVDGRAA